MKSSDLGAYNIEDLRQMAKKRLPRPIFEYVDGGAEDGIALQNNREVYRSLKKNVIHFVFSGPVSTQKTCG